jgi:glycosyltransferase involved in cell wall biosynthesis
MKTQIYLAGLTEGEHSFARINRYLSRELSITYDVQTARENTQPGSYHPALEIRHSYPPSWRWPESSSTKLVYIAPVEFSRVPLEWALQFRDLADLVIVPSKWCRERYLEAGLAPERVVVIPNGVDFNLFIPPSTRNTSPYRFLFIGSGHYRKGLDLLITAWQQAFSSQDDVQLTIKDAVHVYGHYGTRHTVADLNARGCCAPIDYDDRLLAEEDLVALFARSNVCVHPYRGEGFGMHVAEALRMNCRVITTEGGPTDEFNPDLKLRAVQQRTGDQTHWFSAGQALSLTEYEGWHLEADVNHLAETMHLLAKTREDLKTPCASIYPWESIGSLYRSHIASLLADTSRPRRYVS